MKQTMKRLSALLLVCRPAGAHIGACGGNDKPASSGTNSGGNSSTPVSNTGDDNNSESKGNDGEIVTLKVWGFTNAAPNADQINAVAEAASEITRKKLGVEIEMTRNFDPEKNEPGHGFRRSMGPFNIHSFPGGIQALVTNGYASPLDDLLAEYGQGIWAAA